MTSFGQIRRRTLDKRKQPRDSFTTMFEVARSSSRRYSNDRPAVHGNPFYSFLNFFCLAIRLLASSLNETIYFPSFVHTKRRMQGMPINLFVILSCFNALS